MIAVGKKPFSIVEHYGFNCLLKLLESQYKPPLSKYFPETLIPELLKKVSEKVRVSLLNIDSLSITTDIWSSVAQEYTSV